MEEEPLMFVVAVTVNVDRRDPQAAGEVFLRTAVEPLEGCRTSAALNRSTLREFQI
jgi:hypothetical protein